MRHFLKGGVAAIVTGHLCVHCGGRQHPTKSGRPRSNGRFCSPECKAADTRERRARARTELQALVEKRVDAGDADAVRVAELLDVLGMMSRSRSSKTPTQTTPAAPPAATPVAGVP